MFVEKILINRFITVDSIPLLTAQISFLHFLINRLVTFPVLKFWFNNKLTTIKTTAVYNSCTIDIIRKF